MQKYYGGDSTETERKRAFLINVFYFATVALLWLAVLKLLSGALFPFAAALLLTVALQKPIKLITEKLRIKKSITAVLTVILFFSLISGAVLLVGFLLYRQLNGLLAALPDYAVKLSKVAEKLTDTINGFIKKIPDGTVELIEGLPRAALESVTENVANILTDLAGSLVSGVPLFLISAAVMIIASAYLAKDYDSIKAFFVNNFSKNALARIVEVKNTVFDNLLKVSKGYLLIMLMTFSELFIGLSALGFKYSFFAALIIAAVDMLPVFGSGTVLIPWAVICALSENLNGTIGLTVLYLIITAIRNAMEPKIIGKRVGVHPLLMLLSVFLGFKLFGGAGVLLLPMTVILLKNLPWHPKGEAEEDTDL